MTAPPRRTRRALRRTAAALALLAVTASTPALADEYEPRRAGHPVRIVAYVVHPVGVILDYLIMRPAHWIGTRQPFRTIFGHEIE